MPEKTKTDIFADFKKKLDAQLKRMSEERDKLRKIVEDATDVLETWEEGVDGLEDAIRNLNDAVDKVSELV